MTDEQDAVSRAELRKVIAQRQELKAQRAKLQARLKATEADLAAKGERLTELEGGGTLSEAGLEGAKAALLTAAASQEGAQAGEQVASLLKHRTVAEVTDAGRIALKFVTDAGEPLLDKDGLPVRDPRRVCRDFLTRPENGNLVAEAARPRYRDEQRRREAVKASLADPPRTVAALAKLPADVRADVLEGLTPEQRAELVNSDPKANTPGFF